MKIVINGIISWICQIHKLMRLCVRDWNIYTKIVFSLFKHMYFFYPSEHQGKTSKNSAYKFPWREAVLKYVKNYSAGRNNHTPPNQNIFINSRSAHSQCGEHHACARGLFMQRSEHGSWAGCLKHLILKLWPAATGNILSECPPGAINGH